MGSRWQVQLGKKATPVFGKNHVPDALMLVFTAADRFLDQNRLLSYRAFEEELDRNPDQAIDYGATASWNTHMVGYRATVAALRARLELQGFGTARVRELLEAYFETEFDEAIADPAYDLRDAWPEGRATYPNGAAVAAGVTSARGREAALAPTPRTPEQKFLEGQWEGLVETFDDPRFALSLALQSARAKTIVTLDLTDLVLGGYLEIDELPHEDARVRMANGIAVSGPVIVITEGSSDTRWMQRALHIAAPSVAHLFEFLDFAEYKAPGGTDRVVSLTKGMASAGVMNRIVAVLDNDTAGLAAARQLASLQLPDHIAVVTLPDVAFARSYPALGPDGSTQGDLNGRAVSIEFMFGEDVLRDPIVGKLFPVRWQSWIESEGNYQGRLHPADKATVAKRLDGALAEGREDALTPQLAEGCLRLAELILAAARPPRHVATSEFSDISAAWRKGLISSN